MPKGIARKHHNERFNKIHGDIPKNKKGNASRTEWAKIKRLTKNKV